MGSQAEFELDGREALSGIAEVAVALAGFSGLFAAFRRGQGQRFDDSERRALLFMLVASLGTAILALLPYPLFLYGLSEATVWLVGCLSLGVFMAATSAWGARSARLARFPGVFWTLVVVAWALTLLQFIAVSGLLALPRAAVFATGLWWLVLSASMQFIVQAVAATRSE